MGNGSKWWVTLLQGVIAILLGLYLLIGGNQAAVYFGLVAAIYIFVVGLIEIFRADRGSVGYYRGIVGLVVGGLLLILAAFPFLSFETGFLIFAIGVIIVGALGLYASFFARSGRSFDWGPVLINALLLLWGIAIIFFRTREAELQSVTGWILIAIGAILLLWGFFGRSTDEETAAVEAPQEVAPIVESVEETSTDETN